jgi:hypothetical protein
MSIRPSISRTIFMVCLLAAILFPSNFCVAYIKPTTDPTDIGVGARPIGMGKAYVGLADDVNCVFMNPAGLAGLKNWQLQSMTTKLINVIDYVSFAGTYNTDMGTFGLGYVGANLGGSVVTGFTWEAGDPERGIVFPVTEEDEITYTSRVVLLSYGSEAKRFVDWGFLDKVSLGVTLKIFSQGLSGGGISEGMMSGYDMDLGMLYKPVPWFSFGLSQIDALPASAGGKLTDSSGNEQNLPTISKFGMAFKILGEQDSLYTYSQPLVYLLDFDYMPTKTNYPVLMRSGVEWWPSYYLALRMGFDQDIVGTGTSNNFNVETNMTAGVGIQYSGFKFDYAYRKYGIADNDTSYLSLSYSAPLEVVAAATPPSQEKVYLNIVSPQDKLTTYDEAVFIKGQLSELNEITSFTINGNDVTFSPTGSFDVSYPLVTGKNKFELKVKNNDKLLASSTVRILRMAKYKDVPENYWTRDAIESLATIGMIGGYPDGTFKPNKVINRAELTTMLVKAKVSITAEATETQFSDVPKGHWASFYIRNGSEMGIVTGYPDKTFKPAKSLSRAEGVTVLSRFAELKEPETIVEGPFADVPGRHWAAKSITAARSAGMLTYLLEKPFEPSKLMTRAEAAEILSKTPLGASRINNIKDFETY